MFIEVLWKHDRVDKSHPRPLGNVVEARIVRRAEGVAVNELTWRETEIPGPTVELKNIAKPDVLSALDLHRVCRLTDLTIIRPHNIQFLDVCRVTFRNSRLDIRTSTGEVGCDEVFELESGRVVRK
jgi:hypothetical protein